MFDRIRCQEIFFASHLISIDANPLPGRTDDQVLRAVFGFFFFLFSFILFHLLLIIIMIIYFSGRGTGKWVRSWSHKFISSQVKSVANK